MYNQNNNNFNKIVVGLKPFCVLLQRVKYASVFVAREIRHAIV